MVWAVDFTSGSHWICHYLGDADATPCLKDRHIVGLKIGFATFRWRTPSDGTNLHLPAGSLRPNSYRKLGDLEAEPRQRVGGQMCG
jgi:hypothetical protein